MIASELLDHVTTKAYGPTLLVATAAVTSSLISSFRTARTIAKRSRASSTVPKSDHQCRARGRRERRRPHQPRTSSIMSDGADEPARRAPPDRRTR